MCWCSLLALSKQRGTRIEDAGTVTVITKLSYWCNCLVACVSLPLAWPLHFLDQCGPSWRTPGSWYNFLTATAVYYQYTGFPFNRFAGEMVVERGKSLEFAPSWVQRLWKTASQRRHQPFSYWCLALLVMRWYLRPVWPVLRSLGKLPDMECH
jgi:hypothetical protein